MGVKGIKKEEIQYTVLMYLMPYRLVERDVLLDEISGSEERKNIARILHGMEEKAYVERMVIYRKSVTNVWKITDYDDATIYQKRVGYVVERMTPIGFHRLCVLASTYAPHDSFIRCINPDSIRALPWGTTQGKADAGNRCRKKQAIRNIMTLLHVKTSDDGAANNNTMRSEAPPKSIAEAIMQAQWEASASPRQPLPAGEQYYFGRYYDKRVVSNRKTFALDNLMGVLVTNSHAYAVYHTDSYYGSAWAPEYKRNTELEISSFLYRNGMGEKTTTTALMFTSSPKEFADILKTAHGDDTDAKKHFLGYPKTPTETKNISEPFQRCIIVPEINETVDYINFLVRSDAEQLEERLLGAALTETYAEAIYNITGNLKEDEQANHIKGVFAIPENEVDKAMFLKCSFPFSAVLSSAPDAPVVPILLGYMMDLTRISRAYYFYHKTALIGTLPLNGKQHRALIIVCFEWQRRWYKKLFQDAVYLEN